MRRTGREADPVVRRQVLKGRRRQRASQQIRGSVSCATCRGEKLYGMDRRIGREYFVRTDASPARSLGMRSLGHILWEPRLAELLHRTRFGAIVQA